MIEYEARPNRSAIPLRPIAKFSSWPPLGEGGTPAVMPCVFCRDCLKTNEVSRTGLTPSVASSSCSQFEGKPMPATNTNVPLRSIRFVRLPEVMSRTALSKMTIRRWEREGRFPLRRKIGPHAVAWVEAEIDEWCEKRASGEPWGGEQ